MLWLDDAQMEHQEAVWAMLGRFATSYAPNREAFDRDYPRLLTDERATFLIAREDDEIVGYLLANETPTLFAGGSILGIVELYVEEAWRGRGVGWALVDTALGNAWKRGCIEAVAPTRRANGFYQRMGFEPTAEYLKLRRPV